MVGFKLLLSQGGKQLFYPLIRDDRGRFASVPDPRLIGSTTLDLR